MKTHHILIGILACCWACNNIEDATPSERNSFIRFYEAAKNIRGISAEQTSDGFIILASEEDNNRVNAVLIHTDRNGNEIPSDRVVLPNFSPKALKAGANGYYVTGDRIQFNPASENLFDLTVTSAMLYRITFSGDTSCVVACDEAPAEKTDYHGSSLTVTNDKVILLGTFKQAKALAFERPFVTAFDAVTLDTIWAKQYDIFERDYVNSKSVHIDADGKIIWASALLREAGNLSRSYLTIPFVKESSVFVNSDLFAENTDQKLFASDIQPAKSPEFGYGVIGSYASPTGINSNMFFVRVDKNGNFIPGSQRFFDGDLSSGNVAVSENASSTEDTGDALAPTSDGGFILAGSMKTSTTRGNGGLDILLVKVDGNGEIQWNKIIGGDGDETVSSIREASDGSLIICGSNNLSGLSSIFLIRTNRNGDLID